MPLTTQGLIKMIKLEIADVGQLTEREATALGHMFMHLAGHSLHVAPEPKPMTDFEGPEEDNPDNYPDNSVHHDTLIKPAPA